MDAAGRDPLLDRRVLNYHIVERLGAGGMGVVYRAIDEKLGRAVALKFLPQHMSDGPSRDRFLQEARAVSALDHPNIGVIHGIEQTAEGQLFIVLTCYDGGSLFDKLKYGPLPEGQAIDITIQVARALAEAHAKGIIHRDVKPGNIMITQQGVVKLLDFGLAKLADGDALTRTGATVGTPAYMSPEQALSRPVDHRSDIWSVGVVLYEMLTGKRPFHGDTALSTLMAVAHNPPPRLQHLPEALEAVVYRCLAKEPAQRYPQIKRLLDDLERLRPQGDAPTVTLVIPPEIREQAWASASHTVVPGAPKPAPPPRSRSSRIAIGGALTAVLAAGAWFGVARWGSSSLLPRERHIVVLAFNNIGGDAGNNALADGIQETLTSRLSSLEQSQSSLWVAPASEVRRRNINDAAAAQRTFGANLVVSGGVQRDSNGVRLTVNLIDAKSLRQLGSAVIDDRLGDFATLQDNAVIQLAKMLEVHADSTTLSRAPGESAAPASYESYLKALSYLQRYDKPGNLDAAIQLLSAAVKSDPNFALGYARLAEAEWLKYKATNDARFMVQALHDGKHAGEVNDQLAPVHVTLGRMQAETGKNDLAVEEFQHALQLDPRNAEAHQRIAKAYEAQGRLPEAEASLKKAIALRPDYWDGYNSLGVFYFARGKYQDAAAQFRKVLELTPDNAQAWLNLGAMLQDLQDSAGARQAFEKSIALAPSYAAYSNLGGVYYDQGNYAKAAGNYEKAVQINDRDYRPWAGVAESYRSAGLDAKARPAFERAITLAEKEVVKTPNDSVLLGYLALFYAKLGVHDKALTRMGTALALAPADPLTLNLAARTSEVLGDRSAALQNLAAALAHGYSKDDVLHEPDFKMLRQDAAFHSLIK